MKQDEGAQLLGYLNYRHYLLSPLWRDRIRPSVLVRDKYTCQCCKVAKAEEVHHLSYDLDVMRGQNSRELISLCSGCHDHHHEILRCLGVS